MMKKRVYSLWMAGLLAASLAPAAWAAGQADVPYAPAKVDRKSAERAILAPADPVISDDLVYIISELRKNSSVEGRKFFHDASRMGRLKPTFELSGDNLDKIEVYIRLDSLSPENLEALEEFGVRVDFKSLSSPVVQAMVPINGIEAVAALSQVKEITRPNYAFSTAGLFNSQGDYQMATNLIRGIEGADGTGVVVGVISDGLYNDDIFALRSQRCNDVQFTEDLPVAPFTLFGEGGALCPDVPNSGFYGNIPIIPASRSQHAISIENYLDDNAFPEGAAMLEVVHDVAPGAQMLYGSGRTDIQLENSRTFMVANGADVMVENLVFTGTGRYDGTSKVSREASYLARATNMPYFVSVGSMTIAESEGITVVNKFPLFVNGFFNGDPDETRLKYHSWSAGTTENRDEALNFEFDTPIEISLVWDDFWDDAEPRANVDFDLYLVPRDSLSITDAVASSARLQNGNQSNPIEKLFYDPTLVLEPEPLALVMTRKDSRRNARTMFTLVIEQGKVSESQYLTHGVPLNNGDALPPVIAVGQIDLALAPTALGDGLVPGIRPGGALQTAFNSFMTWYEGQAAPTVVGYSGVETFTSTVSSLQEDTSHAFVGPSAAAAHLAGFAAILAHRFPGMASGRYTEIMTDTSGIADDASTIPKLATDITLAETKTFNRHPNYIRPNPYAIYTAMVDGKIAAYPTAPSGVPESSLVQLDLSTDWHTGPAEDLGGMTRPQFRASELGLELKATSDLSWGYWESPLLQVLEQGQSVPRTELRADRLYVAEVRVGTNESIVNQVPDFRLRLITGTGEESVTMVISGLTESGQQPPTTLGGKTYRLYYRPSNAEVAKQGLRFAIDLLHANPNDSRDATIVLREFHLLELPLPLGDS